MVAELWGPDGRPLSKATRARALAAAYTAGEPMSQDLGTWLPGLTTPDDEVAGARDVAVGRIRDLVRNNGWASGLVRREIDMAIGAQFRLSHKPDWRALGISPEAAAEWSAEAEALFRGWALDPRRYCDVGRRLTFPALMGQIYRHYVVDGDGLAALYWLPERGGDWATAVRVLDPDRLSNPAGRPDSPTLSRGVEMDDLGAPIAYHIRNAHPGDGRPDAQRMSWTRSPRETPWGRPVTLHHYDCDRAGQTRGMSRLAPIVEALKMRHQHHRLELQAAVLNAIFAAFIESPFDHSLLQDALSDQRYANGAGVVQGYQDLRKAFHDERRLMLGGVRIPTLFPGERFNFTAATRPNVAFAAFEAAGLRNIAAATGQSYEQVSQDWSQVNYSSARAALLEIWRGLTVRRETFSQAVPTLVFVAVLEEAVMSGRLRLPKGAPAFHAALPAYTASRWIGPGRGWVDPVKEAEAARIRMENGLSTLEDEAAEQGRDYQEIIAQRARERREWAAAGLPEPVWGNRQPAERGEA
jgi:lambda family phage portal protein